MGEYEEQKRKVKELIYSSAYKPMKYKELAYLFQLREEDKPILSQILNELTEDGLIAKTPRGKYEKMSEDTVCGIFTGNARGYGFVRLFYSGKAMQRCVASGYRTDEGYK